MKETLEYNELYNKIKGALIGIAWGDAMGMPGEMWTMSDIREKLGHVTDFCSGHPDNFISAKLRRGEVTDDTINSILIVEMLCETGGKVDPMVFIEKLEKWISTSEKSSAVVGPSTARAIEQLKAGVPMNKTGTRGNTNGGAMKILPVGLVNGTRGELNDAKLVADVTLMCMPTHYTSEAISAACAIAAGGAAAVHGEKDVCAIFEYMRKIADLGEKEGQQWGAPSISARMEMGRYFADHLPEEECLQNIYRYVGTGLPSAESIPAAAALFYLAKGDPIKCAEYTANIGGDTDTMGAMACGICGAYSGAQVFPEEKVTLLETVNQISFDSLTKALLDSCL